MHAMVIFAHSHSLGYIWVASLYIFVGPHGRASFGPTARKVTRVDSYSLVLLPDSSKSIILGQIKFEHMHATYREPSIDVGILWFQSMVPHQICALRIQTPHTPLPYIIGPHA